MTINLQDFMDLAPQILSYIIPGFLFVIVFTKLACIKIDTTFYWVLSIAVSYCTRAFVRAAISQFGRVFDFWETVFWCIMLDACMGVVFALIWQSKGLSRFVKDKAGATLYDGALKNAFDWDEASYVCVYPKNEPCYWSGYLMMADDKPDGWITISAPVQYDCDHNKMFSNENDPNVIMAFPLSDVKRIRIIN